MASHLTKLQQRHTRLPLADFHKAMGKQPPSSARWLLSGASCVLTHEDSGSLPPYADPDSPGPIPPKSLDPCVVFPATDRSDAATHAQPERDDRKWMPRSLELSSATVATRDVWLQLLSAFRKALSALPSALPPSLATPEPPSGLFDPFARARCDCSRGAEEKEKEARVGEQGDAPTWAEGRGYWPLCALCKRRVCGMCAFARVATPATAPLLARACRHCLAALAPSVPAAQLALADPDVDFLVLDDADPAKPELSSDRSAAAGRAGSSAGGATSPGRERQASVLRERKKGKKFDSSICISLQSRRE